MTFTQTPSSAAIATATTNREHVCETPKIRNKKNAVRKTALLRRHLLGIVATHVGNCITTFRRACCRGICSRARSETLSVEGVKVYSNYGEKGAKRGNEQG